MVQDTILNFRPVGKLHNIYRCAAPDNVADVLANDADADQPELGSLSKAENFFLNEATLWIDLRFQKEVDQDKLDCIVQNTPGGAFERMTFEDPHLETSLQNSGDSRIFLGFQDPLFNMESIFKYAAMNWISSLELQKAQNSHAATTKLLVKSLQSRGLAGLFEIIVEHHDFISQVLQAITMHLESQQDDGMERKVVFHCTLGKDRTGIISMLCQSMLGDSDDEIIGEFTKSQCMQDIANAKMKGYFGKEMDASDFATAESATMNKTLEYLRKTPRYGSIDGYLDHIGFDQTWRERFRAVAK